MSPEENDLQGLLAAILAEVTALRQQLGGEQVAAALQARLVAIETAARQASGLLCRGQAPASDGLSAAAVARPASSATSQPPAAEAAGGRDTILVVEDGAGERRTLCKMLRQLGFQVLEATDGREAVKLLAEHQEVIALVLLDMLLPNLGGREAFRWLRRVDPAVKVLLTNGYLDQERVQDVLFSGAAGFLRKPFGPEELQQAVEQALEPRRGRAD